MLAIAQHQTTWGSLEPIVESLSHRDDATVTVVILDGAVDAPTNHAWTITAALADRGITTVSASDMQGRLRYYDIALLCDPYDEFRPTHLRLEALLEDGLRIAYSPYAENIGGEVALHYDGNLHNLAWRVFVPDSTQFSLYAQHCRSGDAHVRSLGSVKGDWVAAGEAAAQRAGVAIRRRLGTRAVVLWNPHFRRGEGGWSTFERYADDLIDFAARHPRIGLVVRPHVRVFPDLAAVLGGRQFVDDFRRACADRPNIMIDESADYRAAFAASDAMVSDLSSLIPEYLRLGKPVGYLRHPNPPTTVADGAWLPRVAVVDDIAALTSYLRGVTRHRSAPSALASASDAGAGARVAAVIVEDFRREVCGSQGASPSGHHV